MLPMIDVRLQLGELLAADSTTLAPAVNGNKVALIAADFVPDEGLVVGDLTLATFDGSTPLQLGTGTQLVGVDPATSEQRITMKDPAGGLRWEMTGLTVPEETIFGFALLDSTLATLLGVELLPEPLTVNAIGQEIILPYARFTLSAQPAS